MVTPLIFFSLGRTLIPFNQLYLIFIYLIFIIFLTGGGGAALEIIRKPFRAWEFLWSVHLGKS